MLTATTKLLTPDEQDSHLAAKALQQLATQLEGNTLKMQVLKNGCPSEPITLSPIAVKLLTRILVELERGNSVSILPIEPEITTQEAATLLNVSRPHVVKLLEEGQIPHRRVGTHRRVLLKDVLEYKQENLRQRLEALAELTAQAQELDMGY